MSKNSGHEKAPVLAGAEALDNVNRSRKNVMGNRTSNPAENNVSLSTVESVVVPFRSKELLLADCGGDPFIPMKPVVEGMGLDWGTQFRKLQGSRFSATIVEMTIVAGDGKPREMTCLPLRKLPGWLMSIQPGKIKDTDKREAIVDFQNECDDVLWKHWSSRRLAGAVAPTNTVTLLGTVIGSDGEHVLDQVIDQKASALPVVLRRSFKHTMKSRLRTRFSVQKTALIPAEELANACNFVAAYVFEGDLLPKREQVQIVGEPFKRYLVAFNHKGEQSIEEIPKGAYVLSQHELMAGMVATPGDIPVSIPDMFQFLMAAVVNLKSRYEYMTRRAGK